MTPSIQKSVKRVFQVVALFSFLFALTLNVQTNVNGTVDVAVEQADAQIQVACLIGSILTQPKRAVRRCKCFRDVVGGPDIFQGFQVNCTTTGPGCNVIKCLTGSISCYCTP